jgi:hypothetical protein
MYGVYGEQMEKSMTLSSCEVVDVHVSPSTWRRTLVRLRGCRLHAPRMWQYRVRVTYPAIPCLPCRATILSLSYSYSKGGLISP